VSAPEVDVILFNDQDLRHPSRRTRGILWHYSSRHSSCETSAKSRAANPAGISLQPHCAQAPRSNSACARQLLPRRWLARYGSAWYPCSVFRLVFSIQNISP